MVDSILRAAGLSCGLYTSPHLIRLNERIQACGECISDDELMELIGFVDPHAEASAKEHGEVTFFEYVTAVAFEHFRRKRVRLVALETGMGGRLDATNVVTPYVSVITGIGIEHTAYLGKTLEAIAGEKAGIIKPGRPVVCGEMPEEAFRVVERTAAERRASLIKASEMVSVNRVSQSLDGQQVGISSEDTAYGGTLLPLLGKHQLGNCAMAVAAVEVLAGHMGLDLPPTAVRAGLKAVKWPARLQVLEKSPVVILDGAHNPEAAEILAGALKELVRKKKIGLILGMLRDKDYRAFIKTIARMAKKCWTVTVDNERTVDRSELAAVAGESGLDASESDLQAALRESREWALADGGVVCIAGSLYLAGEVLALAERSPGNAVRRDKGE
jgi:dihydrofolate synthase/folylpolyglutamate synthase